MELFSGEYSHLKVSSPVLYCDRDAISRGIVISSTAVSLMDDEERLDDVSGDCAKNKLKMKSSKLDFVANIKAKIFEADVFDYFVPNSRWFRVEVRK